MRFGRSAAPVSTQQRRSAQRGWRTRLLTAGAALALPIAAGSIAPSAVAAPIHAPVHQTPAGGYDELMVPSSMGPVKVQVQWARNGGNAALLLLDGLRARDDRNAWSFETNAQQMFGNDNVTLVMPVGGQSSWYCGLGGPEQPERSEVHLQVGNLPHQGTSGLPYQLRCFADQLRGGRSVDEWSGGVAPGGLPPRSVQVRGLVLRPLNWNAPGMREAIRVDDARRRPLQRRLHGRAVEPAVAAYRTRWSSRRSCVVCRCTSRPQAALPGALRPPELPGGPVQYRLMPWASKLIAMVSTLVQVPAGLAGYPGHLRLPGHRYPLVAVLAGRAGQRPRPGILDRTECLITGRNDS